MLRPPALENEAQRLARLRDLGVLDTDAEAVLDSFTELAAAITGMPIALISLIDDHRQWFKSAIGFPQGSQTPREFSFCGHAIAASEDVFEVENAAQDARFSDNPFVEGMPHVAHYAGAPLVMPGGERIGTICVVDDRPGRLDDRTRSLLAQLARGIVRVLLLRESERNLGARLKAESALRESEAKFRTITEAMPQMVWSCRPDGYHDFFNRHWFEFTGVDPGQCNGEGWQSLVHPDDLPPLQAKWRHSLDTGDAYENECRLRCHTGEYHWVLGRARPVRDDAGRVIRWMGTCTDIHEQKRTQEELQESNQRKDEFLAMLAHELRNPLAPVSTAVQLLQMTPDDPERVRRTSELIGRQVLHMSELVDDLLDVSRVTRGLVKIEHDTVNLQQVVNDALEQVRPQIEAREHAVNLQLPGSPVHVRGDRVRLVQVLANLLNNAAKYTPEGGHIEIGLGSHGGQALVWVKDNGTGIDPGLLPRVFDLFTQAKRTPDRAQGGLGVGLALVRSLVELHGGSVKAESPGKGQGSTFTVTLPLVEAIQPTAPAPEAPGSVGGSGLKVMVVDDNTDAAELLGVWLETQGHLVTVKFDAREALATARVDPADVYVLDIGLPEMDGNELARRLRADPRTRKATLIALTGYGQAQDILRSRQSGFDHHFVKPADPTRLAVVIESLAQQAQKDQPGTPAGRSAREEPNTERQGM